MIFSQYIYYFFLKFVRDEYIYIIRIILFSLACISKREEER